MTNNLEQIDLLRERANVSYEDAKDALDKCNNDVVEALIYLEKNKKTKTNEKMHYENGFFKTLKNLIKKGNEIKFIIKKDEHVIINLPLTILILITVVMPPITITGILVALFTNHKIRLEKTSGEDVDINNAFDKMSTAATSVSTHVIEALNKK